jgi:hypothetical protein
MEYTGAPPAPTGGATPPAPGSGPAPGAQGSQQPVQPGQQPQQPGQQQVTPEMEGEDWYKAINGSNMTPEQKQQQIQAMMYFNQNQQKQNPIKTFGKSALHQMTNGPNPFSNDSIDPLGAVK